jgi:hypothetical protein
MRRQASIIFQPAHDVKKFALWGASLCFGRPSESCSIDRRERTKLFDAALARGRGRHFSQLPDFL